LIEHMDHEAIPDEHSDPSNPETRSKPDLPSPLHTSDRIRWTSELKEKLLWRNGLEFLGLDHAEERFLRNWVAETHPYTASKQPQGGASICSTTPSLSSATASLASLSLPPSEVTQPNAAKQV
jgi:hypothetical protein